MFNNEKYSFSKNVKHDAWSDLVSKGFSAVGIDNSIRDAAQPAINQAKSLLPIGGAIPNTSGGIAADAIPQSTGFKFQSNTSNTMIIAGVALLVVAAVFISREV